MNQQKHIREDRKLNIPVEYREDLNPNPGEEFHVSAARIKPLRNKLQQILSADQIEQLEIVQPGTRLKQGDVYRDLTDADLAPFVAHEQMKARTDQWLIERSKAAPEVWAKLKGRFT